MFGNFNFSNNNNNMDFVFQTMLRSNPQFAKFVADNKGKTPEQIAKENNIDYQAILNLFSKK